MNGTDSTAGTPRGEHPGLPDSAPGAAAGPPGARAFVNGKVFTGTGPEDFVSAFVVEDGHFTWTGPDEEVPAGLPRTDLGGATVLPGLLDVHTHPMFMAVLADSVPLLPPAVGSCADLVAALRAHPAAGADPEAWITGFGYAETRWPDGPPTRRALDAVSAGQPVLVRRADGHSGVCNSAALRLAGLDRNSPDPEHGHYGRDADGELTGELVELAAVESVARLVPEPDRAEMVRRLVALDRHFLAQGIVGLVECFGDFADDALGLLREARQQGWRPRTGVFLGWRPGGLPELTAQDRRGEITVAGTKLFLDGAFSNRTAWTDRPYPDSCSHGMRTCTDEDLLAAVAWARRNGVQVAVHAMGDRAVGHVVELLGDLEPWMGEHPSVRIEHATLVPAPVLQRMATARMVFGVVSHSIFFYAEHDAYDAALAPDQREHAYPLRSLHERLRHAALASDAPTTAWARADDVFLSVAAAVRRRDHGGGDFGRRECLSVGQALELYTGRAAAVAALPGLGSIRPGHEASFVVPDRDPFTVAEEELAGIGISRTWWRGRLVHDRGPA
ncbi:hypothetical protein AS188_13450 [Kocuria flava]|uniref:Amidohydrolase n=1 Tax=Kocuria flava TaxID=446860 RepID=A0A0U3HHC9_9MICC|nr:amidohydrolase family protein [Kocuria flava]ALU40585.1 hypothetical protein AS188_13450 [Kocuria flava]GEO92730.1 amidohydrolase [Kocuria flava]